MANTEREVVLYLVALDEYSAIEDYPTAQEALDRLESYFGENELADHPVTLVYSDFTTETSYPKRVGWTLKT